MKELFWIVIGMILDRLWNKANTTVRQWQARSRWDSINEAMQRLSHVVADFDVAQLAWNENGFRDDEMRLKFSEAAYALPKDVKSQIYDRNVERWGDLGFQNNEQIGVKEIACVRMSDSPTRDQPSHAAVGVVRPYSYFDSKATHFQWHDPETAPNLRELLGRSFANAGHDSHAADMPTPLSVGLSIFCEGGRKVVIAKRTRSKPSGGHVRGGHLFNPVGENCHRNDLYSPDGKIYYLSCLRTAWRGLREEMGVSDASGGLHGHDIKLHSLVWDKGICDFKVFGYVILDVAYESIVDMWRKASDKAENAELIWQDIRSYSERRAVIKSMLENTAVSEWSPEARHCTLYSILHAGLSSSAEVISIARAIVTTR